MNVGKVVKQQLKQNKQMKFVDTRFALGITSSGLIQRWTPPSQGTTTYTRVADQICVEKIEVRFVCEYGDAIGNPIRAVLMQTTGGFIPATLANLFNWGGTGSEDVTSDYLPYIRGKQIRVLWDSLFSVVPNANTALKCEHLVLKPKLKMIDFTPGSTTCTNGDLFWVFISDSAAIPHPAVNIVTRVYFTDP